MKLKKLFSFAAAMVIACSVAVTASADWTVVDKDACMEGLSSGTDMWLKPVFCNGDATDIAATDYGIDLSTVKSASFTFTVKEDSREFFDGDFGGGMVASWHTSNIDSTDEEKTMTDPDGKSVSKYTYYNWWQAQYWGVKDPSITDPALAGEEGFLDHLATDKTFQLQTMGNYTYRLKGDICNPITDGNATADEVKDLRIGLKGWGDNFALYEIEVTRAVVYDKDGKALVAFDGAGNKVDVSEDDEKDPEPVTGGETGSDVSDSAADSSADSAASGDASAADSNASATEPSTSGDASGAVSAPAETSTPAAESSSSNTGLIIGIIAGVAVIAVVVIVIVVKKKKG